jgi:predicted permease
MINNLLQDVRYGMRVLSKRPAFTAVVVVTLALGIGANTAIFSAVDAALLQSLPYTQPEQLVQILETRQTGEIRQLDASYPDYLDWRKASDSIEEIGGYTGWGGSFTLMGRGTPQRIEGQRVTASFFSVLGVKPALGRAFEPDEDLSGAAGTVILSYGLWQREFGGDADILGQQLNLDGGAYTVLGVLPRGFQFAPIGQAELFVPLRPSQGQINRRFMHWLDVIARLKPGVTLTQAQSQMDSIAARIEQENADSHSGSGIRLVPLREQVVGAVRPLLLLLLGAVGLVLLIACANVANLTLVHAATRRKEIGTRLALGATRGRLAQQLLSESLLLSVAGGILGLILAEWGIKLLITFIPAAQLDSMPYLRDLTLNTRVFCFTGGLSLVTGVVFGLIPALQSSTLDLHAILKEGGRSSLGGGSKQFRRLLIVSEIALAMVLLVGAGLMIRSTRRLLDVKLGFNPERLATMRLDLPGSKYSEDGSARAFHQQLLARVEAIPGVVSAATVNWLPMQSGPGDLLVVEGRTPPPPGHEPKSSTRTVSAGYFRTMGIDLIRGRAFDERDNPASPGVLIINHALADRLFPSQDPIGHRISFAGDSPKLFEIIGVVDDERVGALDAESESVIYRPYLQEPWNKLNLVVRTTGDPSSFVSAVREQVRAIDPDLAIYAGATMTQLIADTPATFMRRFPALLMSLFAAVALVMASIGIYGVISYSVTQRAHEIGIRLALGASQKKIYRLVVVEGLSLAVIGIGAGLAAALLLTRLMSSLLFGVSATDPITFVLIALILIGVAVVACFLPARRASRIDPMMSLRYE